MIPQRFSDLAAQAAIAMRWPTFHGFALTETELDALRADVEAFLGALPQSDVIEPWEEDGEPWELRIDLPDLTPDEWVPLFEHLTSLEADFLLVPGVPLMVQHAEDQGWFSRDRLVGGGVWADVWREAESDEVIARRWMRRLSAEDPALGALAGELTEAVRRVSPDLQFRSVQGDDLVQPIVHPATGRFGVELSFSAETPDRLADPVVRSEILCAIADVVEAHRRDPQIRLAPDLAWDPRFNLTVVLWFIAPAVEPLFGDQPWTPRLQSCRPSLDGLGSQVRDVEWQVLPKDPAKHEASAVEAADKLALSGVLAAGGMPRWLRTDRGWSFAPVWRFEVGKTETSLWEQIPEVKGARGWRLVPGCPRGLDEIWGQLEPRWVVSENLWFFRAWDPVRELDWEIAVEEREAEEWDSQVVDTLDAATGGWELQPIRDSAGRRGLEAELALTGGESEFFATLERAGRASHPALSSMATFVQRAGRWRVQFWEARPPTDPDARIWEKAVLRAAQ